MDKQPIIFAEPFMTGAQHAPFNAAMLHTWALAYSGHPIILYSSRAHWDEIEKQSPPPCSVRVRTIPVLKNKTGHKIRWVFKHLQELLTISFILLRSAFQRPFLIYFAFLSPPAQLLVSIYTRFFSSRQKIIINLHGLGILKDEQTVNSTARLYARFLIKAFKFSSSRKQYLVLDRETYGFLTNRRYLTFQEIAYIPHPYLVPPVSGRSSIPSPPLVFLHIGIARLNKNSDQFFRLALEMSPIIRQGGVVFRVVGPVLPEIEPYTNSYAEYPHQAGMLPIHDYRELLKNGHYAIFCYPAWQLSSSGAVMDAIAYGKPILGLETPALQALFAQAIQPPGCLYSNFEDLLNGLKQHMKRHDECYETYIAGIKSLQDTFHPENVALILGSRLAHFLPA